jgi:rRNA maturation protein Nop10
MRQQKRIFWLGVLASISALMSVRSFAGTPLPQTGASEKTQSAALPAAKEELLTELPSSFDKVGEASWVFGNSGSDRYAYAAKRGKKWLMIADGKEGPEFVEVDSPRFSANGQHFAYRAVTQRSGSGDREFVLWLMVVDAKNGPEFEEVSPPVFSPDGHHFAYRGKRTPRTDSREVLMLDGKEIKEFEYASQLNPEPMTREFDEEGQPVFSPDGKHWAYRGRLKKNKEIILLDGQESPEFEEITNLVFSPDSQHFAYRVKLKKKQESIVLDGKETGQFDAVTKPVFSPDSRRLGYFAKREKKWRMMVDGQEGPEFEPSAVPSPYSLYVLLFSPDSQHVAQLSLRGKLKFGGPSWDALEIHDSRPPSVHHFDGFRESMAALESPIFSPDGQRLAYILWGRPKGKNTTRCGSTYCLVPTAGISRARCTA